VAGFLPDHSTIIRFRNTLLDLNLYEQLFAEINKQLESKGLLVKESKGYQFSRISYLGLKRDSSQCHGIQSEKGGDG